MRYLICSKPKYLQEELDHIANVFNKLNNYPTWTIKQLLGEVKYNHHETSHEVTQINEVNNGKKYHLLLPRYSRSKGEKLIRLMKKALKSKLPDNIVTKSAYMATRLRDKFNIKTKIVKEHHHDISYCVECPEENFNENYVGKTGLRLSKRVISHNGGDTNFHILKHSVEREYMAPSLHAFSFLGGNYLKTKFCRKVTKSLLTKEKRSTLNTQEKSVLDKLSN